MTDRIKLKKDIESEAVARTFKKPEVAKRRVKTERQESSAQESLAPPQLEVNEISPVKLVPKNQEEENEEV
jgi:hypothetical protein